MFDVTPEAITQIKAYFAENPIKPIRIFLHSGGCGGPQIAMAIDEANENDKTFKKEGFDFLVDKAFLVEAQPIKVDFQHTGFKITSAMVLPQGGCGGCGSSSSCCSS